MENHVRDAVYQDIPLLVDIHCLSLNNDLLPRLGHDYLSHCFFPTVLTSPDTFTLVFDDGKPKSFVIFTRNSHELGILLAAKKWAMLKAVVKKALADPFLIRDIALLMLGTKMQISRPYDIWLESTAELYLIATHPDNQSKGYGSELVGEGLRRLAMEKRMCLVKTSSEKAAGFYKRAGFIQIGYEFRGHRQLSVLLNLNGQKVNE